MKSKVGGVSRRALLKGVSATAILSGVSAPFLVPRMAGAQDAKSVRVLSVEDPFFFSMKAMIPEFEQETGIKVELESLSYDALQARLVSAFVAKTSDADVIAVDQMWLVQYLDNGWIIKIGRGLDFYQKPGGWFEVGANDLSLRKCLETKVDIFRV